MRYRGEIATQIKDLPDGAEIKIEQVTHLDRLQSSMFTTTVKECRRNTHSSLCVRALRAGHFTAG